MTDIFIHIHKAGGTTMMRILDRVYQSLPVMSIDGSRYQQSRNELSQVYRDKSLKLIKGHQFFGIHEDLNIQARYFSIVRNPYRRTLSLFNYLRQINLYPEINDQSLSLAEFLLSGHSLAADNGMVRFIGGFTREDVPYGDLRWNHFDTAMENAKKFAFIGLAEEFDLSLFALKKVLGWQEIPNYRDQNKTTKEFRAYQPNSEDYKVMSNMLRYDIALYAAIEDSFYKDVKSILGEDIFGLITEQKHRLLLENACIEEGRAKRVLERLIKLFR